MRAFRYLFDPLCATACLAYALNRWLVAPHSDLPFLHGNFNDLLLIAAALPPVLWLQRKLGWRTHDLPPTPLEILGHWLIWSIVCEGLGPLLIRGSVGDWMDVAAYAAGALAAGIWWNRKNPRRADFDPLARHYDWMEVILAGNKLSRCRNAFLTELPPIKNALLVGEGHGRFLSALAQTQPEAEILCVDSSAEMLRVARRKLPQADQSRVTFLHRDLLEWHPPDNSQDLISTHFFLDCFSPEQLEQVVSRLARAARKGAVWVVSDFQIPHERGFRRTRARAIHWLMYVFFRFVTRLPAKSLEPPAPFLARHGFVKLARQEYDWGLLYAEIWRKS